MSPVLLDHRNLKWICLSVSLFILMGFLAGYILGFEKSNNKWLDRLDPTEITLPNVLISDLAAVEPQIPEIEEPGANIDVDSVDGSVVEEVTVIEPVMARPVNTSLPDEQKLALISNNAEAVSTQIIAIEKSVPVEEAMGFAESLPESSIEVDSIVDDASEETARYSVQVGMYRSFDNAATKVEALLNSGLSAYINDYKNKNDEPRYNVRFGYFQSFSNAGQALKIYQQNYSGSGYIARFVRE